jgi:hypothetical protein
LYRKAEQVGIGSQSGVPVAPWRTPSNDAMCNQHSLESEIRREPAMASKLAEDPRIDPRLKAVFGNLPVLTATCDVISREDMLADANAEAGKAQAAAVEAMFNSFGDEAVAPLASAFTPSHAYRHR